MRTITLICLNFLTIVIATVPPPPEIVQRFQETEDFLDGLYRRGVLPGFWHKPLDGAPLESWLEFVRDHGTESLREG